MSIAYLKCLFFLNFISVNGLITGETKISFNTCLEQIVNTYFNYTINVLVGPKFKEMDIRHSGPIQIGNTSGFILPSSQVLSGSYTISYEQIDDLIAILTETEPLNTVRYVIIANHEKDLLPISEILWQFRLHKSVILLSKESEVDLYVIDLKSSKCGTVIKPKKINKCTNGNFYSKLNLFSPDLKKFFYNCAIRIIWSKYVPWIYGTNDTESGIYRDILKVFGETSHFNVTYMPQSDVYSEELALYNFGSVIADFDGDYADIFVGLVDFSISSKYVWTTGVIYDDNMYFVVPNPKMIPYWKSMFKIFFPSMWILCGLSYTLTFILFTLLAASTEIDKVRYSSFLDNAMYLFALSINVGYYELPRSHKLRIMLSNHFMAGIILVSVFQAKYYSLLSSPLYEKKITNIEQLLNSDIPIKATEGMRLLFLFPVGDPNNKRILDRMEILSGEDFAVNLRTAYEENFATITDRGVLIMNPQLTSVMQVFKIFSFLTCFLVQKNHILYEHINRNITTIVETGFVDKFVSEMKFKYSGYQYFNTEKRLVHLTLTHMEGPLIILLAGYILAFAAFCFEHIYCNMNRKK